MTDAFSDADFSGMADFSGSASVADGIYIDMEVDRPFIFLIRDGYTGATLFVGRVADPSPAR